MICKYCNSENTIKFGTYNDVQRYYCKDCNRKFVANTLPKMQTPINQVTSALRMYYSGMPLDGIQGLLEQEYGNKVAESTIYYWITKFTKQAIEKAKGFNPDVGDVWIADETGIDVHGHHRDIWFWDIIDAKTRYLLASHISVGRTTEDAQELIQKAVQRAGKYPRVIITDKLRSYIDGIDLSIGLDKVNHIRSKPFTTENSTNKIERFHGTFKDRVKVVRAFKNMDTARLLTDGWLIHYNFFKEHEALGNVPPAVKMGKELPFTNWIDVVRGKPNIEYQDIPTFTFNRPMTKEQKKHAYNRTMVRRNRIKKRLVKQSQPSLTILKAGR